MDLLSITIGLENLLNDTHALNEALHWNKLAKDGKLHLKEDSSLTGSIQTYRTNIIAYRNKLKYYNEHYEEIDLPGKTATTDKFFTEEVDNMRDKALNAVNILRRSFEKYENNEELLAAIDELCETVNLYTDTCIHILKSNPRLKSLRTFYSIDRLIEKYNLYHI